MVYWEAKVLMLVATPERHKSQPTGFSGLREATIAPTVTSITMVALPNHQSKTWVPGCERISPRRRRLKVVNATESDHSDQASREAARLLIPPSPRSRPLSFFPSVTTPLYSSTVSQTLRQSLRRTFHERRNTKPLPRITLHDLRHTCASLLFQRNVHPKFVRELLGHASVAITLETYSHMLPGMGDQTVAAMQAALSQ